MVKEIIDLTNLDSIQNMIEKKTSRQAKLNIASDLLYKVEKEIREHDYQYTRLMNAGEIVDPTDSIDYAHNLGNVKEYLEEEVTRLLALSHTKTDEVIIDSNQHKAIDQLTSQYSESSISDDDLIPLKEVAKMLGISYSTIRKNPWRKDIPTIKLGSRVFARRADLRVWLDKQVRQSKRRK